MIKLICTDIDGTLVPPGTAEMNPEIFDTILKLKEKGIIFAAASGRQCESIINLFQPIKDDMIFIGNNGAVVMCRDQVMSSHPLKYDDIKELVKDIRELQGCSVLASGAVCGYVEPQDKKMADWLINGYQCNMKVVDDLLTDIKEDIYKISLFHPDHAEEIAAQSFIPKWENHERIQTVCAGKEWIDSISVEVNKGNAISAIQKTLNILPSETMAFGDELNDIEMLKQAEYSFAVGNARDEVKQAAKFLADTNINDGVLKEMKKLIY
ncbi:HAD family hydrolase [Anaerosacchariphilus polymeriproducens]|uniref:HAD family hydrolase n=1 Tax=Anaerosacchariphilus polymeriproducens TaxID=1812858 RepID=A0A371ASL2_9FIRM|nr:HAD family hydrolase [Anaerosacchariphilus polymeriproducens]RDU22567.1 HAD family hydrolase [Anaerosacchariphilus polymeriproducens]